MLWLCSCVSLFRWLLYASPRLWKKTRKNTHIRLSAILKYVLHIYPFQIIQTYWIFHMLFLFALRSFNLHVCACVRVRSWKNKTENMNIFDIRQHEFYIMIAHTQPNVKKPVENEIRCVNEQKWMGHTRTHLGQRLKIIGRSPAQLSTNKRNEEKKNKKNAKSENRLYRCFKWIMKWTFFTFAPSNFSPIFTWMLL